MDGPPSVPALRLHAITLVRKPKTSAQKRHVGVGLLAAWPRCGLRTLGLRSKYARMKAQASPEHRGLGWG